MIKAFLEKQLNPILDEAKNEKRKVFLSMPRTSCLLLSLVSFGLSRGYLSRLPPEKNDSTYWAPSMRSRMN